MPKSHPDQVLIQRARTDFARAAIDASDVCASLAELVLDDSELRPGELTLCARRVRLLAIALTTYAVRADLLASNYRVVAEALGVSEDDARRQYGDDIEAWLRGDPASVYPGLPPGLGMPTGRWSSNPRRLIRQLAQWREQRRQRANAGAPR
jgi:hypothetical protein